MSRRVSLVIAAVLTAGFLYAARATALRYVALMTPGHWGALWPAFAFLWCAGLSDGMRDQTAFVLGTLVVIPLCLYPAIYLFSSWSDVEGHVRTSFIRLLVPIAPAALMFSAVRLKRALS